MNVNGQKYLFWNGVAHGFPHTLPEIYCDPEVIGKEPCLRLGS